ncbi:MAG: hypothetical protein ACYCQI_03725 [Gammaproteobacteria bacterium]
MNSATNLYHSNSTPREMVPTDNISLKFSAKNERKLLKAFLVGHLQKLFCDLFQNKIKAIHNNSSMECYTMDSKIIQLLIQGIVETGEYTLEGIAYYTRIPFDVIYDAACGISNQFSITPWVRIVDLYTQVRPEVVHVLIDKLLQIKDKNHSAFSSLLNET